MKIIMRLVLGVLLASVLTLGLVGCKKAEYEEKDVGGYGEKETGGYGEKESGGYGK